MGFEMVKKPDNKQYILKAVMAIFSKKNCRNRYSSSQLKRIVKK